MQTIEWSSLLHSGARVFIGSNAAVPQLLIENLMQNRQGLSDLELIHIFTLNHAPWAAPNWRDLFTVNSLFLGPGAREAVEAGYADYTPCSLSEIPALFKEEVIALDAAIIMVSPPDKLGFCSLGVSVDVVASAVRSAKTVIAQINPQMPRTSGHSFIHLSDIDCAVELSSELPEFEAPPLTRVREQIGQYVSLLVEDGDTLQLGMSNISDAVLRYLHDHKNLGLHTEVMTDTVIELIEKGVINNRKKSFHKGKSITAFCMGSRRLYDFVDNNPHVEFYPAEHVNSPAIIARNDCMVAINSAIEVDLTGQVVSDSIGYQLYSGIGGQVDFIRGAAMSRGGKPIIALPSTAKNDSVSRIVPFITEGGGVVTSRGDVHYVVTEYGIASLRGKSIRERALELIKIAHPKFRDELLAKARAQMQVPEYQKQAPGYVPEFGEISDKVITLAEESFIFRPLVPSDERRLQRFFYSHKKETLLMRYNYRPTRMSRETSSTLVGVDQSVDVALCITSERNGDEKIHAVGRYYYIGADNSAEVAFVVREAQQGKGMAKLLLRWLIKIAKARQLSVLRAYTRTDNKPMQAIFTAFGFAKISSSLEEVHFEYDLSRSE
ncbi:MAG: GNAT family N-acetyltransferase [Pseudomonadales bacterium]